MPIDMTREGKKLALIRMEVEIDQLINSYSSRLPQSVTDALEQTIDVILDEKSML